jgi:hypothetical protein
LRNIEQTFEGALPSETYHKCLVRLGEVCVKFLDRQDFQKKSFFKGILQMFRFGGRRGCRRRVSSGECFGQNVRALLVHPVGRLELAVALSNTCVYLFLHFGTPCYNRLCYVCWITLFTNKPMCESHWSEPVVCTPTLTRHQMIFSACCWNQFIKRPERCLVSSRYADCCKLHPSGRTLGTVVLPRNGAFWRDMLVIMSL